MKRCPSCTLNKQLDQFSRRGRQDQRPQSWCRECKNKDQNNKRKANKQKANQQHKVYRDRSIAKNREFVYQYLLKHPCVDCGESDPIVLEFDHLRDKTIEVSTLVNGSYSIDRICQEIDKCEVRCANCHRRKTAHQLKWWIIDPLIKGCRNDQN
jgi:hypothetical protein